MINSILLFAPQPGQDPGASMISTLIMFAAIFLIMYFLMIRPQQKRMKEREKMLSELKKGDKVVLNDIMGKEMIAQKFTHNFIINAEGKLPDVPLPIKLTEIVIPYHTYYAEGIGLVKSETESAEVSVSGIFNFKTPKSVSTLVNYKINN